jgi:hypothetical protein
VAAFGALIAAMPVKPKRKSARKKPFLSYAGIDGKI